MGWPIVLFLFLIGFLTPNLEMGLGPPPFLSFAQSLNTTYELGLESLPQNLDIINYYQRLKNMTCRNCKIIMVNPRPFNTRNVITYGWLFFFFFILPFRLKKEKTWKLKKKSCIFVFLSLIKWLSIAWDLPIWILINWQPHSHMLSTEQRKSNPYLIPFKMDVQYPCHFIFWRKQPIKSIRVCGVDSTYRLFKSTIGFIISWDLVTSGH